ncbi:hypothetical protein GOP47_0015143 [Adiantum capillus-veneris]|uniref:Uncharacterized protein n=1 Tax=Adiantum capillus-veneris TaxID=13818 RepID=A0A9D4UMR9_ADICA|nr:hypothetical protein GOP47_0015143 [Adiantum capillus-veneris]
MHHSLAYKSFCGCSLSKPQTSKRLATTTLSQACALPNSVSAISILHTLAKSLVMECSDGSRSFLPATIASITIPKLYMSVFLLTVPWENQSRTIHPGVSLSPVTTYNMSLCINFDIPKSESFATNPRSNRILRGLMSKCKKACLLSACRYSKPRAIATVQYCGCS